MKNGEDGICGSLDEIVRDISEGMVVIFLRSGRDAGTLGQCGDGDEVEDPPAVRCE